MTGPLSRRIGPMSDGIHRTTATKPIHMRENPATATPALFRRDQSIGSRRIASAAGIRKRGEPQVIRKCG